MSQNDPTLSRRGLLRGAAALGTASALVGCGDDPPDTGPTPDATPLNDLLRAEYQLIANLTESIAVFAEAARTDTRSAVLQPLTTAWRDHHREHAAALAAQVVAARGTPVAESSVSFSMPQGYTRTVLNAMRLACNSERVAALAGTTNVRLLTTPQLRFLAGTILANNTQKFIAFYGLLLGLATTNPGMIIANGIGDLVLVPFVSSVSPAPTGSTSMGAAFTGNGLNSNNAMGMRAVPDFAYT